MLIVINSNNNMLIQDYRGYKESKSKNNMVLSEKSLYISRCQDAQYRASFPHNPLKIPFYINNIDYPELNNKCIEMPDADKFSLLFNTFHEIDNEKMKNARKTETIETSELYNKVISERSILTFPKIYSLSDKNLEIFKNNLYINNYNLYKNSIKPPETLADLDKSCGILFIFSWIFHFLKDNIDDKISRNIFIQLYGYMYLSFFVDDNSIKTALMDLLDINNINDINKIPEDLVFARLLFDSVKVDIQQNSNRLYTNTFYRLLGIPRELYGNGSTFNIYEDFLSYDKSNYKFKLNDKFINYKFPIEDFTNFFNRHDINPNDVPLFNMYNKLYSYDSKILKKNIEIFNKFNKSLISSIKIYERMSLNNNRTKIITNNNRNKHNQNINNIKNIINLAINNICNERSIISYILKIFYHKENNDNKTIYNVIDKIIPPIITRHITMKNIVKHNPVKLLIVNF